MKKQMKIKKIGVWMDHSEAKLIDPENLKHGLIEVISAKKRNKRIAGESSDGTRIGGYRSTNNEFSKHEREQNTIHEFYEDLAEKLVEYDEILIFGPTTARHEFYNFLHREHNFLNKFIKTTDGDYITDNQLVAFVKKSFE